MILLCETRFVTTGTLVAGAALTLNPTLLIDSKRRCGRSEAMSVRQRCSAQEQRLDRDVRALRIENDLLAATVLLDKGADIYQLIYKPRDLDVLWKTPWGLKEPGRGVVSAFQS